MDVAADLNSPPRLRTTVPAPVRISFPLSLLLSAVTVLSAAFAAAPTDASAWLEDLQFLAKELPARHANAFATLPRREWEERVARLAEAIPQLAAPAIQAEFMRLVAALGDSHTSLRPPALFQTGVPLRLVAWPDAIRVFGIAPEHAALPGAELVAIEGQPLAAITPMLARVLATDNAGSRQAQLAQWLTRPKLLQALGLAKDGEPIRYEVVTGDGRRHTVALSPAETPANLAFDRPPQTAVTDQRGQRWHHFELLAKEGIAYVQFNRCASDPQHDLAAFIAAVKQATTPVAPQVWVFDLQYNGGGNSALGDQLFASLIPRGARVIGIIGPHTYSSALLNAMSLKSRYGATLIGRPTGGRPAHFGEVRTFTLPRSQLAVQYSTKRFVHGDPQADALAPDHVVARTHADYRAGRDPLLEQIRELARR